MTNTEVEVDGRKIAKGSMVVAAIGAANRDPAHFSDPDRLDNRGAQAAARALSLCSASLAVEE